MVGHGAVHFIICSVGTFFNSFAFSFNVIGESVKSVFGLTQSQVELVSSMYFVGTGLNLVPGYFYDKIGPRQTVQRGLYLALLAWSVVTVVSITSSFFQGRYLFLSVIFFAAGHSKSFLLLPMMVSGLNTYSKPNRGKALAFLATLYTIGPLGSVAMFSLYFKGNQSLADKQKYLPRFLVFLGIVLSSMGVLFCFSPAHSNTEGSLIVKRNPTDKIEVPGSSMKSLSYAKLLFQKDVMLFGFSFALVLGVAVAFETNVPFFMESVNLIPYSTSVIVIHRICQGTSRLAMGYFVDCIKSTAKRVLICAGFGAVSVLGLFTWRTHLTSLSHIYLGSVSTGLARGVYGLINVVACESYELSNHGKIYGLADTILALSILCLQEAFGIFYVSAIGTESGTVCHGQKCLEKTSVFLGIASAIGTGFTVLAAFRPRK